MSEGARRVIAQNRRARHDYFIEDTLEAGLVLTGSEVKSLRQGRCSIGESYVQEAGGELYLRSAHIAAYDAAKGFNHEPLRLRKILVHRREMARLIGQIRREGYPIVPLAIYFNPRGIAKIELGMARGKRKVDKRQTVKTRDWQRQKARLMRERG
ncbi:MAG: SsrA-binding protein SmpB [Hyphomicrobiales bacterium]|nr:MAG: SsrA-binding protein SmpB [Hyphomicrobiales bacterium]